MLHKFWKKNFKITTYPNWSLFGPETDSFHYSTEIAWIPPIFLVLEVDYSIGNLQLFYQP